MELNRKNMKRILLLVSFTLVLVWLLYNIAQVYEILLYLFDLLSPFIMGICITFVLNLILCPLERIWFERRKKKKSVVLEKIRRPVCIIISVFILLGAVVTIFFVLIPELEATFSLMSGMLPIAVEGIQAWWMRISLFFDRYDIVLPTLELDSGIITGAVSDFFTKNGDYVFDKTIDITVSIASTLLDIVLAFVFSIYMLMQKEKVAQSAKKILYITLKEKRAKKILHLLSLTGSTFSKFVRAQIVEALIMGVLCFAGMSILRLPYALVISVVISFTALIPIFGAWAGTFVGTFLILFVEPVKAIWFIVFIILLQQIEGNLIYPKVVGSSVGLPGIWVLVAVTIGGSAFGVVGMLFAVPVFSIIHTLVEEWICLKSTSENLKI